MQGLEGDLARLNFKRREAEGGILGLMGEIGLVMLGREGADRGEGDGMPMEEE